MTTGKPIVWTPSRGDIVGSRDGTLDIAMIRATWDGYWLWVLGSGGELSQALKRFPSAEEAKTYAEEHV